MTDPAPRATIHGAGGPVGRGARSIIGSEFTGRIEADTLLAGKPAIIPSITGRAWITGTRTEMLDPEDPWPAGYRLSDTWPTIGT